MCSPSMVFIIGILYWTDAQQPRTTSVTCFLTAAKLDPQAVIPFIYLGHYYSSIDAVERGNNNDKFSIFQSSNLL